MLKMAVPAENARLGGGHAKTADEMLKEAAPKAKAMVPDIIKAELLQRCRSSVTCTT